MSSSSQPARPRPRTGNGRIVSPAATVITSYTCAFDLCEAMDNLKLCGRCKDTWYCSREHQKQHWKVHKTSCSKITTQRQTPEVNTVKGSQTDGGGASGRPNNVSGSMEEGADSNVTTAADAASVKEGISDTPGGGTDDVKLKDKHDLEESQVREDIAQFSENIRRKHSCTLTPCTIEKDDSESPQQEGIERDTTDPSSMSKDLSKEQKNSLSSEKVAGSGQDNGNVERNTNAMVHYVIEHMYKFGVCVLDKFLRQDLGNAIIEEVKALRESNKFQNGQLVTSLESGSSKDIRGDMIAWSDGSTPQTKNIGALISKIDLIIQHCKEHLEGFKNINGRTEAMVACYPGNGTHYVKHVDNPNKDGRCVTCIYYLNKGWDSEKMGGTLRLYPRDHKMMARVEPIFNRLIVFWSDRRNPHEVLPAFSTRYAITVWYFDSVERQKALQTALS